MEKLDEQGRGLSTTVWTQLDRKAGAITELTIRPVSYTHLTLPTILLV